MSSREAGRTWLGALVGLCCAALALGPALKPGYLLFYDMVFVPRLDLSERTLGIDGSVPRAVPGDLVVALGSQLAPGWVVQKVLLLLVFVGAGAGAASFFRHRLAAIAAAVAAAWNPYLGERLAIGHWGFLLGYATMPFLLRAVLDHRRDPSAARVRLVGWTLLTALTGSTGAVIGLIVTAVALLAPIDGVDPATRLRRAVLPIGAFLVANSAWWFPFLFLAPRDAADPAGVTAFMSRSDTPLGVVASVATGGGIWNEGVWFADRSAWLVAVAALGAVVVVLGVGIRTARAARVAGTPDDAAAQALPVVLGAGLLGLGIACASALPGGREVITWLVTSVPGGGLLRDSQKFVAPWMLAIALAAGLTAQAGVESARRVGAARLLRGVLAGVVVIWPIATFPGMAGAAGGKWRPTDYPDGFSRMVHRIDTLPDGKLAVFPWNLYRRYAWNSGVVTLDPWQRLLDRGVVVNDDLPLSDRVVRGESADATRISTALRTGGDLRQALRAGGIAYVLVQTDQPQLQPFDAAGLAPIAQETDLALYRIGPAQVASDGDRPPWRWVGLTGLPITAAALVVLAAARRRSTGRTRPTGE